MKNHKSTSKAASSEIRVSDQRRVQACIDLIEGNAYRRCVSAQRVRDLAEWAEAELTRRGIQPAKRKGAKAWLSPEEVCACYGYPAKSTTVKIARTAEGWVLFSAARVEVSGHRGGGLFHVILTTAQRKTSDRTAARNRYRLTKLAREVASLDDESRQRFEELTAKLQAA